MRLLSVDIQYYKRFEVRSRLHVNGPLVAVVGPNEAGKTSLLEAMEHLSSNGAFERTEFTQRQKPSGNPMIVRARYAVEAEDRKLVDGLLDKKTDYVLVRWKRADEASAVWNLEPRVERDGTPRAAFLKTLTRYVEKQLLVVEATDESEDADTSLHDAAESLLEALTHAGEDLETGELDELRAFQTTLTDHYGEGVSGADAKFVAGTKSLVDHEAESNPTNRVGEKLLPRVPEFLLFDDDNRNLAAGYVWAEHAVAPDALANLCDAADVDYDEFRAIATDPTRKDELATLELAASEQLKKVFASWTQAGMRVAFKADTEMLLLHVYDDAGKRAIPFDQRSAGLRSFVALIAFVIRYAGAVKPVLLIDEAETHLHYGGQADLVQVFERQEVAQTIIYTTHSVGCLPEDLGTTIRCVAQVGDERSEVRNGFWSMDVTGAGLTPLMLAMGATAFAFTPSRFAVIGEGPTEAILLPSLFREARAARHEGRPLGFQVAPGIARVSAEAAAGLELDAGNLAYLVDADEGGRANGEKLPERVKNEKRLFILGDDKEEGLCTEDLLDVEVYVDAVNRALRLSDNDKKLTPADLPDLARPAGVKAWCKKNGHDPPEKPVVADHALALAREGRTLVHHTRKKQVAALYEQLRRRLGVVG